jgi:hypothetical protein
MISGGAVHLNFDPIGGSQFEVSLDDGPSEVIHLFKQVPAAIVEVSLPMPLRVSTRARRAENEELRIGRPSGFLNVTAMLTIRLAWHLSTSASSVRADNRGNQRTWLHLMEDFPRGFLERF